MTILAVIGTVFLRVLEVLLFLFLFVCLLLVLPIHYQGGVRYQEELQAKGKITWLCAILSLSVSYQEGQTQSCLRIFGIDLFHFLEKRKEKKRKKKKKAAAKKKAERESKPKKKEQAFSEEKKEQSFPVEEAQEKKEQSFPVEEAQEKKEQSFPVEETQEKKEQSFSAEEAGVQEEKTGQVSIAEVREEQGRQKAERGKHTSFADIRKQLLFRMEQIKAFFQSLCRLFRKIKKKIDWAGDVKAFWKEDNTSRMVCILKHNVVHLWRKIKPRVLRGEVIFGTGDPCSTGQILGAAAMGYAAYGRGVQVVPDFEKARLEGHLLIKGRISIITIVVVLIRILLSSEWKQFRREAEQLKEAM
jgi:hypothetical protein